MGVLCLAKVLVVRLQRVASSCLFGIEGNLCLCLLGIDLYTGFRDSCLPFLQFKLFRSHLDLHLLCWVWLWWWYLIGRRQILIDIQDTLLLEHLLQQRMTVLYPVHRLHRWVL